MCPLQVGDEVLTVNGRQVAEMSYTGWKSCMEEALQEGSLVMDIRHHGRNSECVCVCVSVWCVCVCVCVCVCSWTDSSASLLNSFDSLNWSVNYCEIICDDSRAGGPVVVVVF